MNEWVKGCQRAFGGRWVGVKFFYDPPAEGKGEALSGVRFCEAVTKAYIRPVILRRGDIDCNGASYIFGWKSEVKEEMIERMHREAHFPLDYARRAVEALPVLNGGLQAVGLNLEGDPDVLISYLQPEQVMKLLRLFEGHFSERLRVELSSIVAVCGNIAAKAYLTGRPALSFGCKDSRGYGAIPRDRVVVGLPQGIVRELLK